MMRSADELKAAWMELRASEKGLHGLELAERLGVRECQLLSSASGTARDGGSAVSATRLAGDWKALIAKLPGLGRVKAVTRNRDAVIEVEGVYDNIEFFGPVGQSVSSLDLRIFTNRWRYGFAVRDETPRGLSTSLQFFDETGQAIHKIFLRPESDLDAFGALVREFSSPEQGMVTGFEPAAAVVTPKPDDAIDVEALRAAWRALKDTHEFFGMLRTFGVTRTQALRLVGEELAYQVAPKSLDETLRSAAAQGLRIMVFVGNCGVIQIYSGTVHRVAPMGDWINVLDPAFNLHVRTTRIANAWVVRKPTVDGFVTALELYTEDGEQIAQLFGERHTGEAENQDWRALVTSHARV
ncbi:MAG: hypothetical protein BGO98_18215 [Myxococcales bacterium 68-20]|nr:hemin-degrading factor [Myxococcales bacterium]OJY23961.1 MAG: hypothetical protein BGO98_18215 [Myxococcales bacterium 68-20]